VLATAKQQHHLLLYAMLQSSCGKPEASTQKLATAL